MKSKVVKKIVNKSDFALNYSFWGGFSVKMYLQFDEYFENLVFLKNTIFRKKYVKNSQIICEIVEG